MRDPSPRTSRRGVSPMQQAGYFKFPSKDDCPDRGTLHTPMPSGYREWHERAREMRKTHKQERCPTCGYWAVWTPKGDAADA